MARNRRARVRRGGGAGIAVAVGLLAVAAGGVWWGLVSRGGDDVDAQPEPGAGQPPKPAATPRAEPYDPSSPLTVGAYYRADRELRVLRGSNPAALTSAEVAELRALPGHVFTVLAGGTFRVARAETQPGSGMRWYLLQVAEENIAEPVEGLAAERWIAEEDLRSVRIESVGPH